MDIDKKVLDEYDEYKSFIFVLFLCILIQELCGFAVMTYYPCHIMHIFQ